MNTSDVVDAELLPSHPASPAVIQISLGFFPLAFFLFFCTPVVVINGVANRLAWGSHQFAFPPGHYTVKIFFPYLFLPECGANSVSFPLEPGGVRRVRYFMWPWMFAPGSISVT